MKNQLPVYLFHQGTNYCSHEFLGSHFGEDEGNFGVFFRVYAKNAESVAVVGDFNGWNTQTHLMKKIPESGIYELFIPNVKNGAKYKYAITKHGKTFFKADPFAFYFEKAPQTASIVWEDNDYVWQDVDYLSKRANNDFKSMPINVYEVCLGGWKRHNDGSFYTYREFAEELVDYLKKMNYTHVQLLPLTEYTYEGSCGYQVDGYFAITSRFGTPNDFKYFVDKCHENNIGVIIDFVPAYFSKSEHGLIEFDGSPLFEYEDQRMRERGYWGARMFDHSKTEVQSFLISSAVYFCDNYHVDGIKVDAVSSMLYLDYEKQMGEWQPNDEGGNVNKGAVAFLQKLNAVLHSRVNGVLTFAEESTAFPQVTAPTREGGLGFDFKWNMGWKNDVLEYMQQDAIFRSGYHNKMTFSMMYAFTENFILPLSHDEMFYGKNSLISKMPGEYEEKFAQIRALMGYTYSHPGKKLNFMGSEIGQFEEWDYNSGTQFFLLEYESHRKLQSFFKKINEFYLNTPAFYEIEDEWAGFNWLIADDKNSNVFAYERISKNGNKILVAINFSGVMQSDYKICAEKGKYKLVFDSDAKSLGGEGRITKKVYTSKLLPSHGKKYSIVVNLPPYSFIYLEKVE